MKMITSTLINPIITIMDLRLELFNSNKLNQSMPAIN